MARGGRRQYTRDSRGRFSSSGSSRQGRPPAQRVKRGTNRLTRDNAGRITSVGGEGATARGGRLRTAGGRLRATQTARLKGSGGRLRKPVGGGVSPAATRPAATQIGKALGGSVKKTRGPAPKNTTKGPVTLKGLQKAGGNRWQKNGMDRVYFNNIAKKAGFDVSRYNTGNISSAAIKGRKISNTSAGEIMRAIGESKVYYDRGTRKMMTNVRPQVGVRQAQQKTAEKLITSAARKLKKESRTRPKMWRSGQRAK